MLDAEGANDGVSVVLEAAHLQARLHTIHEE